MSQRHSSSNAPIQWRGDKFRVSASQGLSGRVAAVAPNWHVQMSDGSLAVLIGSLDPHKVVARFGEAMLCHRVTILRMLSHVAVRFHREFRAASPKSHLSLPNVVRKLRILKVTGSPARMFSVGAKAG